MHVLWCAVPCVCLSSVCLSPNVVRRQSSFCCLSSAVRSVVASSRSLSLVIGHWPTTTTTPPHQPTTNTKKSEAKNSLDSVEGLCRRFERTNEQTNERTNERSLVVFHSLTHSQTTNHKPPPSLTHSLTHFTSLHSLPLFSTSFVRLTSFDL